MRRAFVARRVCYAILAALVAGRTTVFATGFFINQQSVKGLARVDAGNTVAADELGTVFFNPAALTRALQDSAERLRLSLAVHEILPRNSQQNRGSSVSSPGTLGSFVGLGGGNARNPTGPSPVPNSYGAKLLAGGRASVGFGLNAPFGLTTTFDPSWHGRYDAIEATLKTINGSIVASYGFGGTIEERRAGGPHSSARVFVGGGLDLQHASTVLAAAIPNPLTPGGPTAATDGGIRTEGHNTLTAGFNVGLLWISTATTRVGVHYRSRMTHDINGTSTFTGLQGPLAGLNGTVGARAAIALPDVVSVGGSWQALPKLTILGDTKWFNWSRFDEVRIQFADGRPDAVRPSRYQDAWAFSGGFEAPAGERWAFRGGVHYDMTPTVDGFRDTTVPDSPRLWLGAGTSYQLNEHYGLDLAFNHVFFRDTQIDLTRTFFDGTPLATAVNIRNDVTSTVNTIAVDFHMKF